MSPAPSPPPSFFFASHFYDSYRINFKIELRYPEEKTPLLGLFLSNNKLFDHLNHLGVTPITEESCEVAKTILQDCISDEFYWKKKTFELECF